MDGHGGLGRVVFVGGWAEHRHVGDDAILRVHLDALRAALPAAEPVVLGAAPDALADRFGVRTHVGLEAFVLGASRPAAAVAELVAAAEERGSLADPDAATVLALLRDAGAVVDLGAGSLASRFRESLWTQAATLATAAALGVPTVIAGTTLGPVEDPLDAMMLGRMLRDAAFVSVRDAGPSLAEARRLGRSDVVAAPDPAVWLRPAEDVRDPVPGPFAVLAADAAGAAECGLAVRALAAEGIVTVGVPMDFARRSSDVDVLAALRDGLPDPAALRVLDPVPDDAALVRGARVAYGSRYHLGVFAAAAGTPAVLLDGSAYTERRLAGLASDIVRPLPAGAGAVALRDAVLAGARAPRGAGHEPAGVPPAIAWLEAHA